MTTQAERDHMEWIASLPCGCCDAEAPSMVHHPREGVGGGQRSGHFLTIPLCWECHQGKHGIHGDRTRFLPRKLDELKILNNVIAKMAARLRA